MNKTISIIKNGWMLAIVWSVCALVLIVASGLVFGVITQNPNAWHLVLLFSFPSLAAIVMLYLKNKRMTVDYANGASWISGVLISLGVLSTYIAKEVIQQRGRIESIPSLLISLAVLFVPFLLIALVDYIFYKFMHNKK